MACCPFHNTSTHLSHDRCVKQMGKASREVFLVTRGVSTCGLGPDQEPVF